ncbi:transmembrane protein 245-like [Apostichopus japonicus]|uniref:transmembrane protein 245-like n=1 Tax=Stichopus japonicus TaxID=307972 RepID=UPI003AB87063
MATLPGAELRSPLDSVLTIVPQNHEKALRQAFYNALSFVLLGLVLVAVVSVYYVLEIFLRPLVWATLIGIVLYPFKYTLSSTIKGWLGGLEDSATPLAVGAVTMPLSLLNFFSEKLGSLVTSYWRIFLRIALGLVLAYFGFWLLYYLFPGIKWGGITLYSTLNMFGSLWTWTIFIAYVAAVFILWKPDNKSIFRIISIPMWFILVIHIASYAGPFQIPLVLMVAGLTVIGYTVHSPPDTEDKKEGELSDAPTDADKESKDLPPSSSGDEPDADRPQSLKISPEVPPVPPGPPVLKVRKSSLDKGKKKKKPTVSSQYLYGLLGACILVRLYLQLGLILKLLPIPVVFYLGKKFAIQLGLVDKAEFHWDRFKDRLAGRESALLPGEVRKAVSFFLEGDKMIIGALKASVDTVTSIVIILSMFIGVVVGGIFLVIQIQQESLHMVDLTTNLINETIVNNPEMQEWLPATDQLKETMDDVLEDAFMYGRDWIKGQIHTMIGGTDEEKEEVEEQVLQMLDQLYLQFVAKAKQEPETGDKISLREGVPDVSVGDVMSKLGTVDYSNFVAVLQENLETIQSVLESVWSIVMSNVSIITTLLGSASSVLLSGGTAILNFLLASIVFMTTLFYLLSYSRDQYLPMCWVSSLIPANGGSGENKYGKAFENAIRDVFGASIKMSSFYGLYTWLTHTVFGLQVVYLPAALAAIFGAVPFLGTYWAVIPGVVELLVLGDRGWAVALFVCQLLPMFLVDAAIYADIKSGGHPYITALSIAGGMCYYGIEGALIGPMVLCLLLVIFNIITALVSGKEAVFGVDTPDARSKEKHVHFE